MAKPIESMEGRASGKARMSLITKVTSKGQITVPRRVRQHLQLSKGDRIEFLIGSDGTVTLLSATANVTALKGMVTKPKKSVSLDDMKKAIEIEGGRKG